MRRSSAILAIAALLFAGCGGDDDPTSEDRPDSVDEGEIQTEATVAAPPTPTAIPVEIEPEQLTYTVQEGDLMSTVAQRFDVPLEALICVNELDDPNFIQIGWELLIPTEDDIEECDAAAATATAAEGTGDG